MNVQLILKRGIGFSVTATSKMSSASKTKRPTCKITNKTSFDCETCNLSKLTNSTNKSASTNLATEPFAKVYTDVAGPMEPTACEGFRYAIIFTDEYSGCSFTYFMKQKSDTVSAMERFHMVKCR